MSRAFTASYLEREPSACQFLAPDFFDVSKRVHYVKEASKRFCSPALIEILREQNLGWGASASCVAHLDRIAEGNAAVVVTGQQIGLWGGPLYSVYKAASAIAIARTLSEESGIPVFPVFWLQTEDHDWPEVAQSMLPATTAYQSEIWALDDPQEAESRVSMGERRLPSEVDAGIAALEQRLKEMPYAADCLALLRRYYQAGQRWVDAFAGLFHALFADEGLLLFDPHDPKVGPLTQTLHQKVWSEHTTLQASLEARAAALEEAGFRVQIATRSDCLLSFVHLPEEGGQRFRVRVGEGALSLAGHDRAVSVTDIERWLATEPERWSTSALLRPVLQDLLFPTTAYIGGPGEIAYWAQLPPLYEEFKIPMPMVIPRGRFVVSDPIHRQDLEGLSLSIEMLQASNDETLWATRANTQVPGLSSVEMRAALWEPWEARLLAMLDDIKDLGPGLDKAAQKTRESVLRSITKFDQKVQHARMQHDVAWLQQTKQLREYFFPSGNPQERCLSWSVFASQVGWSTFKQKLFATYVPFATEGLEIQL